MNNHPRIFVISDTHFGETNIIKYFNRPFASAQEMDETIQKRWNLAVRPQDIVIHCGDFCDGKGKHALTNIIKYRHQLNGRIGLILGNHDNERLNYRDKGGFQFVYPYYKRFGQILFCHCIEWVPPSPAKSGAAIIYYGHVHNKDVYDKDRWLPTRIINVSAELLNYTPIDITADLPLETYNSIISEVMG